MRRSRALSVQTRTVLRALSAQPQAWRYGYELGQEVGLKSGSLYPILMRLADRDLLETAWETDAPAGRPPRHRYRLSPHGVAVAAVIAAEDAAALAAGPPARRRTQAALRGAL
jgi:PadR family transcriptional regulator, regulatory protein PadR